MSDDNSLVNNPLFGMVIGQQIGNKAHAEADRIRAESKAHSQEQLTDVSMMALGVLNQRVDALREEVASLSSSESGLYASIAGIRGVTRELLEELRKSDPNNPLLEKKVRDRVFMSGFNRVVKESDATPHKDRLSIAPNWTKDTFNAEGSNKGGPEKSQITPNLTVRAEAEVPSHVSDREKFLSVIEKFAVAMQKSNPEAAILKDKDVLEVIAQARAV